MISFSENSTRKFASVQANREGQYQASDGPVHAPISSSLLSILGRRNELQGIVNLPPCFMAEHEFLKIGTDILQCYSQRAFRRIEPNAAPSRKPLTVGPHAIGSVPEPDGATASAIIVTTAPEIRMAESFIPSCYALAAKIA